MRRLTTDKSVENMDMVELAHNCCYAKDRKARYRDYDTDMDAREFAKNLLVNLADDAFIDDSDETFDEVIHDYLQYGTDNLVGLIALFYRNLWSMADLRETLKAYEDAEEQGLLLRLPCKAGDTVYYFSHRPFNLSVQANTIYEAKVVRIVTTSMGTQLIIQIHNEYGCTEIPDVRDFGKTVFLTREEAESALAEKGGAE